MRTRRGELDYVADFLEFLSIPSVSALSQHKADVERAASWLSRRMERAGVGEVRILKTAGHPVVFGQVPSSRGNAPTVLIYGHYDTQPPDPLEEWSSPPFEPVVREDRVYARGAADDKGGVYGALLATEDVIKAGGPPVNLKFLFEGEEEIGSPNLKDLLVREKDLFACDLVVSVDGGMFTREIPSLTTGSRGLVAIQIDVKGPRADVHSGGHGGAINNPVNALCQIVASMKDSNGRITVDGFYDDVREISESERKSFSRVPFDEEEYKASVGVAELFGEPGYTVLERLWSRPTLDCSGIWGGFQGEGVKTIIPSKASCKITCRLVPDQDPDKIARLLESHVRRHAPPGVTVEVTVFPGNSRPYLIPRDHPVLSVLSRVLTKLYGREPVEVRLGGTLPIARTFLDLLGSYLVFFATSSPDENVHSPNEFYRLGELDKLRRGLPELWTELASSYRT
ncbi:MAG: dipeptidase [Firmicutes bacterium]|nr:dipeptidase [Candidatus Fermentithermobacillaceae bacterium]